MLRKQWRSCLFMLMAVTLVWGQKHWDDLGFPPLNPIQKVKTEKLTLKNGLVIYMVEDHNLPLIQATVDYWGGDLFDPADKVGLAQVAAQVLRTGGTAVRSGDEMDEILEDRAAQISSDAGEYRSSLYLSVLREDLDFGLARLAEIIMQPAFSQDKIDLAKKQLKSVVSRRNDAVDSIAGREFNRMIYGSDSPFARVIEYEHVDRITREDLIEFHRSSLIPNQTIVGVWGDFKIKQMKKKFKQVFGEWEAAKDHQRRPVPAVEYDWKPQLAFIEKSDINQSQIRIGHLGGKFSDEDYHALNVMSNILGGSFGSWLFDEVRTKRGLAYQAVGFWSPNYLYDGTFFMQGSTKTESTTQAIKVFIETMRRITEKEVSDDDLKRAKDSILNSFVFNFDSKRKVMARLILYEFVGYPSDFLQRYQTGIQAVTKADVLRVARKYLHPDKLKILVVAKAADLGTPLTELGLGEPEMIDISIPEPSMTTVAATEADLKRGSEVIAKARETYGGVEAMAKIEAWHSSSNMTIRLAGQQLSMQAVETKTYQPRRQLQVLAMPFGEIKMCLDGDSGWMIPPGGQQSQPLPEAELKDMKRDFDRDVLILLTDERLAFQHLNSDEAGMTLRVLRGDEPLADLVVDQRGYVVQMSYQGKDPSGAPALLTESYSEFQMAEGVPFARKISIENNGQPFIEKQIQSLQINPNLGEDHFMVPGSDQSD